MAAPTAADALRLCQYGSPDLLLLDLTLPDASGLDVLREIRNPDRAVSRFDSRLGVIVLSGRGTERDRVRGLEQGADDYVVKPYHYSELLARIGAVLRRRRTGTNRVTRVAEIEICQQQRSVTVGGEPVELSAKEFSLLGVLATEPTRVFTKEELLRDVWGYQSLGHTRTLEAHASRLRRKLDPCTGRFVVNCWGVGYRLVEP
jgi:DNA-binding response OmpR family regulator